jgi:hypothetical protein
LNVRTVLFVIAASTVATCMTAVAAGAATSPRSLALRASDFPAGAKMNSSHSSGIGGSMYTATFNFKVGGREEEVTDTVWYIPKNAKSPTPGLVVGPKVTYTGEVEENTGFHGEKSVSLPRYGDQQTANWANYTNSDGAARARSALVVLKGRVVWVLTVENCGVIAPYGCAYGATPPKISATQALSELKMYALKQKARVGIA